MRYTGYVADIEAADDASELDFEDTKYQEVDVALVSEDRIRIEWLENDESYAVTIDGKYDDKTDEPATGRFECSYSSWEGRRNSAVREDGQVKAIFIVDDQVNPLREVGRFWIDVEWKTHDESGRFLFELLRPPQ